MKKLNNILNRLIKTTELYKLGKLDKRLFERRSKYAMKQISELIKQFDTPEKIISFGFIIYNFMIKLRLISASNFNKFELGGTEIKHNSGIILENGKDLILNRNQSIIDLPKQSIINE